MFRQLAETVLKMDFLFAGSPVPQCVYWTQVLQESGHLHSHSLQTCRREDQVSIYINKFNYLHVYFHISVAFLISDLTEASENHVISPFSLSVLDSEF